MYEDRLPQQLLTYMRLARLQDPAQLPLIDFERDVAVTELNEYEVLQACLPRG